jgi:hypothetical protein
MCEIQVVEEYIKVDNTSSDGLNNFGNTSRDETLGDPEWTPTSAKDSEEEEERSPSDDDLEEDPN